MTGLNADSPARFIVMNNELRVITLEQSSVLRLLAMEELQAACDDMHKLVKKSCKRTYSLFRDERDRRDDHDRTGREGHDTTRHDDHDRTGAMTWFLTLLPPLSRRQTSQFRCLYRLNDSKNSLRQVDDT
jgi:ABC-type Zn2+ transport system substrate-binding protein/surface adhesin